MSARVLVVAGEVSGDLLAAALVRELRARRPDVRVCGIGGDALAAAGAELTRHVRDMAVMGWAEVLRRYGFFRRVFGETLERARAERPDVVLLVDYPGFNLRFARAARALGLKVVYFVCPQVWAWHRSRIPRIARDVDRMLAIFPFEADVFRGTGLRVDFVGHPLVDECRAAREAPPSALPWPGATRVALLPGSRRQEIERILPAMAEAARTLRAERADAGFLVAAPSEEVAAFARERLDAAGRPPACEVVAGRTREVLRQARAAWVASGTATVEAALMGCPMAVVYRTAPWTYALARRLVRVPHIGMVNLVAGREVCPERIQERATPGALADALRPLLDDTPARAAMLAGLAEVVARLGPPGAAARAAEVVASELPPRR